MVLLINHNSTRLYSSLLRIHCAHMQSCATHRVGSGQHQGWEEAVLIACSREVEVEGVQLHGRLLRARSRKDGCKTNPARQRETGK
jgi:hypothetical protein